MITADSGLPGLYQRTTAPAVLARRRTTVASAIGSGSVALLQGAAQPPGSGLFRQTNEHYHLTGIEVPHAYLTIDGGTARSTLYLPHLDPATTRVTGPVLHCDDPEAVTMATGVDRVRPLEALASDLSGQVLRVPSLRILVPMSPAELGTQSRDDLLAATAAALADPWCDPTSRPAALLARLRSAFPAVDMADLSPMLDAIRMCKDDTEIALLRRAGALCAAGITQAMRATAPGRFEYELAAVAGFVFAAGGARGDGYRAIVAGGTNAWYGHYGRQSSQLADGDLVLMDYAPDFAYYTSDIGRMWPVNGVYSAAQRALYGFIVAYHRALLRRLRPGALPDEIMDSAATEMSRLLDRTSFATGVHRDAARGALDFRGHLSHPVGMSVHDVGSYRSTPLRPGTVISVDPMLWIEPERGYVRCEDTVVITEDGYENLTAAAPLDCDQIEAVMREPGLLDALDVATSFAKQPIPAMARTTPGTPS
jgi:Xaa-Pro aminopeptidase